MEEWGFIPTPFQPSSIAKITDYDWTQLLPNKKRIVNSTKGSQRFLKSHTSKQEFIDYFKSKKGTIDNAIPEITKRITKEYLGCVVSLPDSSVIYPGKL